MRCGAPHRRACRRTKVVGLGGVRRIHYRRPLILGHVDGDLPFGGHQLRPARLTSPSARAGPRCRGGRRTTRPCAQRYRSGRAAFHLFASSHRDFASHALAGSEALPDALHSTHAHSASAVAAEASRENATSSVALRASRIIGCPLSAYLGAVATLETGCQGSPARVLREVMASGEPQHVESNNDAQIHPKQDLPL